MDAPSLRRGVFGYSRKSVQELLADRDVTIIRLSREARDADARMAEIAAELERTRREISEKAELIDAAESSTAELRVELEAIRAARAQSDVRMADLEARNHELRMRAEEADEQIRELETARDDAGIAGSVSSTEEITEILDATDRALTRLIEGARRNAERELQETERARDELREEIDRLSDWRDRLVPLTDSVRRSLDDAQAQTAALAVRLSELEKTAARPGEPVPDDDWTVIRIDDSAETGAAIEAPKPSPPEWGDPDRAARTAG